MSRLHDVRGCDFSQRWYDSLGRTFKSLVASALGMNHFCLRGFTAGGAKWLRRRLRTARPRRTRSAMWLEALESRELLTVAFEMTPVVIEGDPAVGFADGIIFNSFHLMGLGSGQHVAFDAAVSDQVGDSSTQGLYVGAPDALSLVHRQGDTAPGATVPFAFFPPGIVPVRGPGAIAFEAHIDIGLGLPLTGVWSGVGGLSTAQVPDETGDVLGGLAVSPEGLTPTLHGNGLFIGGTQVIDIAPGEDLDLPPTLGPKLFHLDFSALTVFTHLINGSGLVPVQVHAIGKVAADSYDGLWLVGRSGWHTEVARGSFNDPIGLNNAGSVLFTRFIDGSKMELVIASGGALTTVLRSDEPLPDADATVVPNFSRGVSLGGGGQIVVAGQDSVEFIDVGIWAGEPGSLQKVAAIGDTAPGLEEGTTFSAFNFGYAINSQGTVAFIATAQTPDGTLINGIWADAQDNLQLVVSTGLAAALTDDRVVSFTSLGDSAWSNVSGVQDGRSTALNDDNQIAFQASVMFAGSSTPRHGLFVADLTSTVSTTGTISGVIWGDDGNGVFDLVEQGIADVSVELFDDSNQRVRGPILTDGDGTYHFDNLPSGTYFVQVTNPTGTTFTGTGGDAEIGSGGQSSLIIIAGGIEVEADAGLIGESAVAGVIWDDIDRDGRRDTTPQEDQEPGVAGVKVELLSSDGEVLDGPVLTGDDGTYRFEPVASGQYRIRVTSPSGTKFTTTGGDSEIGSDGRSDLLTVTFSSAAEADAGLLSLGPTANLISGDIDLTPFAGKIGTIGLRVKFSDKDGVDGISLLDTSMSVLRAGSDVPVGIATVTFIEVGDGNGKDRFAIYGLQPPGGQWGPEDLGDYFVLSTTPTAKDTRGVEGEVGELVGLFSLVDTTPPSVGEVRHSSSIGLAAANDRFLMAVEFVDALYVDATTFATGNFEVRGPALPLTAMTLGASSTSSGTPLAAAYAFDPPAGGFTKQHEGRYEILTTAISVKDLSGNAVKGDQVVAEFSVDLTPPTALLDEVTRPGTDSDPYSFIVRWQDPLSGVVAFSTTDSDGGIEKLRVRTPQGNLLPVKSLPLTGDDEVRRDFKVTYLVDPPGGTWDQADEGVYVIETGSLSARDDADNRIAQGTVIGFFDFSVATESQVTGGGSITIESLGADLLKDVFKLEMKTQEGRALIATVGRDLVEQQIKTNVKKITGDVDFLSETLLDQLVPESYKGLFQVTALKNARLAVDNIVVNGPLGQFLAPALDLMESLIFANGPKKLQLGNVQDDHLLQFGPPVVATDAVTIVLDRVANTDIVSLTPIKELIVTEWIDDDGDPDVITAPWIGKITVKGDAKRGIAGAFQADLNLSGQGAPKGLALGSVTIAGSLSEADWSITGNMDTLTVATGTVSDFGLEVSGAIKTLKLGDVSLADVVAGGAIGSAQALRWTDGSIAAPSLGSLKTIGDKKRNIPGDSGVDLSLAGPVAAGKPVLGDVSIAGKLLGGDWIILGNGRTISVTGEVLSDFEASFRGTLTSMTAKGDFNGVLAAHSVSAFSALSLTDARILVGTSAGANGELGDQDDFVVFGTLGTLKITQGVTNSVITVGLATRNDVPFDADDDFAGSELKSLTIGGLLSANSRIAAGKFPAKVWINKLSVRPSLDPRFVILVIGP